MSEPKISEESERLYYTALDKRDKGDADGYAAAREKLFAHIAALESEAARLRAAQEWRPIDEYNLGGQPVLTSRLVALGAAVETQFPPFLPNTTHFRVCPKGVLPPPPKPEPRAAESAKE